MCDDGAVLLLELQIHRVICVSFCNSTNRSGCCCCLLPRFFRQCGQEQGLPRKYAAYLELKDFWNVRTKNFIREAQAKPWNLQWCPRYRQASSPPRFSGRSARRKDLRSSVSRRPMKILKIYIPRNRHRQQFKHLGCIMHSLLHGTVVRFTSN